jgi:hypothetical protein
VSTLTLQGVQRLLLGIIQSVEAGVTTPEDAFEELKDLKARALGSNINFTSDYSIADFKLIRIQHSSEYDVEFFDDETYEDAVRRHYEYVNDYEVS